MTDNPETSSFGGLLRYYRKRSVDKRAGERLSQDQFAKKLSRKIGFKVTRNRVGNWETNKTSIPVYDRKILMAILIVLHEYAGITRMDEADRLLEAGGYRKLDEQEKIDISPSWKTTTPAARGISGNEALPDDPGLQYPVRSVHPEAQNQRKVIPPYLENLVLKSWGELETMLAATKDGPQPSWPRILVGLSRGVLDRWTTIHTLKALLWLWLWLLTWLLIAPSLHWPFASQEEARLAMVIYAAGTLLIPPFIATLIQPKNNKFWQEQKLATNKVLYLYVYQGAGIGFHLGYFAAFLIALSGYHFHLPSAIWSVLMMSLLPLGMGYVAAELVPFNLWRVYGRLTLTDGGIFFVFLILGPIWGYLFLNFYATFLTPIIGITMILLAATSLVALMTWQQHRTGTTIIPAHWWLFLYGTILILYEISSGQDWYIVISLTGLIILLGLLLAHGRIRFTLSGMITLLLVLGLLLIVLNFNLWLGRILAGLLVFGWWRWGRRLVLFPPSFWIVVLIDAGSGWALRGQHWSGELASAVIVLTTLIVILWEYFHQARQ